MERQTYLNQAKVKMAKYCSGTERAPYQVLQKLTKWELDESEAQQILAELIAEEFVNEERFVKAYCNDKFSFNQWGKIRIKQELYRLRIADEVIQTGLNYIDPEKYEDTMLNLAMRKWNSLKDENWIRKQKTTAYLVNKGFEIDLATEVVRKVSASQQ